MENLDEDEEVGPAGEAAGGRGSPCACRGGGWRKDCNSILSRGAAAVGLDSRRVKIEVSDLFVGQLVSEVKSLFGVRGLVFPVGTFVRLVRVARWTKGSTSGQTTVRDRFEHTSTEHRSTRAHLQPGMGASFLLWWPRSFPMSLPESTEEGEEA